MTSNSDILSSLKATISADLVEKIVHSKLLLVGAGGIGCELLKNLALTGFTNIVVIDLDTIDVSNLNRQLLFRSQHVGQPKCVVACQVAAQLAVSDNVSYTAHHGNVCDNSQFHVEFVKGFDLILNALDNVVARRRVNRLALAAGVPLIEAGTTGYLGQVTTIHKASETACYECQTQETGKVYPICTIRSTPSAPVHCIVWAKELYKLLFGVVEESMLYEDVHGQSDSANGDKAANGDAATGEPSTYMQAVMDFRQLLQQWGTHSRVDEVRIAAVQLVRNLYVDEIQKQLDMDRYKTAQKKPVVLAESLLTNNDVPAPTSKLPYKHTDIWSPAECFAEFVACLHDAVSDKAAVLPTFDKDDTLAMRFVTATSNLRATVFGIEPAQSYYSAKGIAGNIIPAISTTNAIVAGLQILQCFQVLRAQMSLDEENQQELTTLRDYCSYVNCLRNPTRNGLFLTAAALECPNKKCFVCAKAVVPLQLNIHKWTLQDFVTKIVKADLGFENPSIMMDSGDCIWEEGDDADSDEFAINLPKLLTDLPSGGIVHGAVVTVEDFSQDLVVEIAITHVEQWDKEEDEEVADDQKFVVGGTKAKHASNGDAKKPAAKEASIVAAKPDDDGDDDDDSIIEVVNGESGDKHEDDDANGAKRGAVASDVAPPTKKAKPSEADVIEVDDDR
jgi:ubiquitin-like 1-activating enzyme E1 B